MYFYISITLYILLDHYRFHFSKNDNIYNNYHLYTNNEP